MMGVEGMLQIGKVTVEELRQVTVIVSKQIGRFLMKQITA